MTAAGATRDGSGAGGALVLVATPIGNLGDLSPRAVQALTDADVIACEDTRKTGRLLAHAGVVDKRLLAVHDHNEAAQTRSVLALLDRGRSVAVVTDAGTPGISDPGGRLAGAVAAAGGQVTVVPGPSALVAALVVSGLSTARFVFEGFLPRKGGDRSERLAALAGEHRTMVLYEAPHRLAATLSDLVERCGPLRQVAVIRELTKLHEEVWRGTLAGALERARGGPPRGEHVLVVAGAPVSVPGEAEVEAALQTRLSSGRTAKEAVAEVAGELKVPKRRVYDAALRLRS
ncbi:MAG: 16S rRNA (cytidine(1402)-2'-O)-methyltransferase [Actinobacteria bacterium]|nr:MAG: 16S rRNA (cytidine(1402)-2'-O)-methyltransferase [Actinomycetota bacterium]